MFPRQSELPNHTRSNRFPLYLLGILFASFLITGCSTMSLPTTSGIKYDARVLWVVLQNYVTKHPQMNHQALSRISVPDLVKSGDLSRQTVANWERQGLSVAVHPENFRAPGDGVVCQINDSRSLVMATKSGEIKGMQY
ncbi:MAG: hypothetical protein ABI254_05655 [Chthoniobacterales bacterium]